MAVGRGGDSAHSRGGKRETVGGVADLWVKSKSLVSSIQKTRNWIQNENIVIYDNINGLHWPIICVVLVPVGVQMS